MYVKQQQRDQNWAEKMMRIKLGLPKARSQILGVGQCYFQLQN
jgi:hypothetical protein